jgi:hypothetical protein
MPFRPATFVRYATWTWTRPALATLFLASAVIFAPVLAWRAAFFADAWVWFATLRLPAAFICHAVSVFHDDSSITPVERGV